MASKKRDEKKKEKKRAREHLEAYFQKAESVFHTDRAQAHRLVRKARRLAMRHRMRIPFPWSRRFCRSCYSFLKPGVNARIRVRNKTVILLCKECNHFRRFKVTKNKIRAQKQAKGKAHEEEN